MKDKGNARPVLARVADFFDSRAEMAERLNANKVTVNTWFRRGHAPAEWAPRISAVVGGKVSIEALVHEASEALRELVLVRRAGKRLGVDGPIEPKSQEGGQG